MSQQQVQQLGYPGRGEEDLQELSQLHLPVLLEGVQESALAAASQDLPALESRKSVQASVVLREGGSHHVEAHLGAGEARLRVARSRGCEVLLLEPGNCGEVHQQRLRGPGRAYIRQVVGPASQRDGSGPLRRGDQTLQVVQPGDPAGAVRGCLRGQRGTHQRSRQMGETASLQVREDSPGLCQQAPHLLVLGFASG